MAETTILVVEDEEQVRMLIVRLLQKRGYSVLQAENGRKALALAADQLSSVALVITDMIMPEMGGVALIAELRKQKADLHILCMTGYTKDEVIDSDGVQNAHFIEKPFTPNVLLERVENILSGKVDE